MSANSPRPGSVPVVLAVDADPGVRAFLRFMFQLWGVAHHTAADGREAAALVVSRRVGVTVALVDGPAALAAVRATAPGLPCWVMTPDADPSAAADLLDRGAAGVLAKPFHPTAILTTVRSSAPDGLRRSCSQPGLGGWGW